MTFEHVTLITHADWSINAKKRWMAIASLQADGNWAVLDPIRVDDPSLVIYRLRELAGETGCVLAGFDFPIGFPSAYAQKAGVTDFLTLLPHLGEKEWEQFYNPAETPGQISLYHPFYPQSPGGTKREHLERGLGLDFEQLYRLCETAHENRSAACPLFWTLGGQQVGKAVISGWKSMLSPALKDPTLNLKIWPFSGTMNDLCRPGNFVIAETYPAEFYAHLGLPFTTNRRFSKRKPGDRRICSPILLNWAGNQQLDLEHDLSFSIQDGFGSTPDGEDRFDALVGLFGMINIIVGNHPNREPSHPNITKFEGWILGQEQPTKETINARFGY
jgi:hypothetical protein